MNGAEFANILVEHEIPIYEEKNGFMRLANRNRDNTGEIQPLLDKDREDLFPLLNEHIFRTHKTLVQSMGNLFFDVLKDKNFEIRHYMNEKYGEKSRIPMI